MNYLPGISPAFCSGQGMFCLPKFTLPASFIFIAVLLLPQLAKSQPSKALTSFTATDININTSNDMTVGWEFQVNADIAVTRLGFYDVGTDGLLASHEVGLWDLSGNLLGSVTVTPASAPDGGFLYENLTMPVDLVAGNSYRIGACTLGDAFVYGGEDIVTSAKITSDIPSESYRGFPGFIFPDTNDGRVYLTSNFEFVQQYPALISFDILQTNLFTELDRTLGWEFQVICDVTVTKLGFYDVGSDGLLANHEVGLWDLSGTLLGSVTVTPASSETGGFYYEYLSTPVELVSGNYYRIGAYVYGDAFVYDGENIITNANIDFGDTYSGYPGFVYPEQNDGRVYLTCNFMFTSEDDEYPEITCPSAITQSNDPGECGAEVEFEATATDNCSYEISYFLDYGDIEKEMEIESGHYFKVGTTTVTAVATDPSGNEDVCTFDVIVNDDEDPTAVCQSFETYLGMDGTVTLEPEDVDGGSYDNCGFELSVDPDEFDCEDMEGSEEKVFNVTLTVTDDNENTDECTAQVTVKQRPTTLTYNGDLSGQYSDEVNLSATLTDDLSTGDPLEGMTITFEIGTQSITGETDENGVATATLVLTQDPCDNETWVVKTTFDGECPFRGSSDEDDFDYQPEDAELEYTGTAISATESMQSNNFTVTLRAAITDDDDGNPGDISNAMARFLVDGNPVVTDDTDSDGFMPVIWISESDHTIGMIETIWESSIPSNPTTFDVKIELDDCYYTGMSVAYPLTVYNAVGDFITGGGYMFMTEGAAGFYAPTPGSKLNFGFNVKFNKKGRNLQGKMNIIYRMYDGDELVKIYQIKSNAATSLGTNLVNPDELIAEFVSRANLTDVTDPENPVEISGSLTLHATMTDKGEPGDEDMISFTLYDGSPNALWFSSNWTGTKSIEQLIDGGNLVVHSGAAITPTPPEGDPETGYDDPEDVTPVPKGKGRNKSAEISGTALQPNHFTAYPNPFSERVRFEFVPAGDVRARIDMFDVTGRLVKTVFDQPVKAGVLYNAEFKPGEAVSSFYIYRMTMGEFIYTGKLIYQK